jgi:branched-chain amino acid aminotransferase
MVGERKAWYNGRLVPWENATVHILSHGFSRGAAIFEVFSVHPTAEAPSAFRMDLHFQRLFNTARLLGMELAQSEEELGQAVKEAVLANKMAHGFIKMMAFYGEEAFGTLVPQVKLDLSVFAIPADADRGLDISKAISACICRWRKLHPETVPVEAKTAGHYVNGMLARQDALRRGYDVGIMLDTHGFVAEGSIESIFLVKDGVLRTPPLGCILPSVSRRSILEVARQEGMPVEEKAVRPEELFTADELFTSASPFKVLPIGRMGDRILPQAPGPVSTRLNRLMEEICIGRDPRFKHWLIPLS